LMTSAARLHRPMARTSPDCSLPGKTWFYHREAAVTYQSSGGNVDASAPLVRQRHYRGAIREEVPAAGPIFREFDESKGRLPRAAV
jgi:hypothetical protein